MCALVQKNSCVLNMCVLRRMSGAASSSTQPMTPTNKDIATNLLRTIEVEGLSPAEKQVVKSAVNQAAASVGLKAKALKSIVPHLVSPRACSREDGSMKKRGRPEGWRRWMPYINQKRCQELLDQSALAWLVIMGSSCAVFMFLVFYICFGCARW